MNKNLRNTLAVGAGIGAIALIAESCPVKEEKPVFVGENSVDPVEPISRDRKSVKSRLFDVMEPVEEAGERVNYVDEIRECVEDAGRQAGVNYFCFSNPFGSTRCYSQFGGMPITISNPYSTIDDNGEIFEKGLVVSVGPGAYKEVFTTDETADACDYAVDLLDEDFIASDVSGFFCSDQVLEYWSNVPDLAPSLALANYKLFYEIEDDYDIREMGGNVFEIGFGDRQTVIFSDIAGERDERLDDTYTVQFHVKNPRGVYRIFDDPNQVVDYLDELSGLQE